jgi:hypothetical protein
MFHMSSMSNDKEGTTARKRYPLLSSKIAESDIASRTLLTTSIYCQWEYGWMQTWIQTIEWQLWNKVKPITSHNPLALTKMQSLSDYTKLRTPNDILRSFDLENNNENLEEDYPFDYFLQPNNCMVTKLLEASITQHCIQDRISANLCLAEIWFMI